MIVEHRPDGRTLADTRAMAAVSARPVGAVRRHCEHVEPGRYDVEACINQLAEQPIDPVLISAADAQRYLRLPVGTVYSWAHRKLIRPLDVRDGQPLYDVNDLLALRRLP